LFVSAIDNVNLGITCAQSVTDAGNIRINEQRNIRGETGNFEDCVLLLLKSLPFFTETDKGVPFFLLFLKIMMFF